MADAGSQVLRHLNSLPDNSETDIGRTANRWIDKEFKKSVPDTQQSGMTKNQALILMYRNGFPPFCKAMLASMRASGKESLVRQTV